MKVLIVAKTRQHPGACVGGITAQGRSVRLVPADPEAHPHPNLDYAVGEVWEVELESPRELTPPHVENMVVRSRRRLGPSPRLEEHIRRHMPPLRGGPEVLFGGLAQVAGSGALFISRQGGVPDHSTTFWEPDQPLVCDDSGKRIRYRCGKEGPSLVYVGFAEPVPEIPAGTLVRVSLAHWWKPEDAPAAEERCYVQISGWFGEIAPAAPSVPPRSEVSLDEARKRLREVFGYDELRPVQDTAVERVLAGQDTLAVMPTGGGKSLCYQLPALLFDGLTVVISPLISLMRDQVEQLFGLGIPATFLNSSLTQAEYVTEAARVRQGKVRLLYLAPETLVRPETLRLLDQSRVRCIAIDEAHCISQWGHDFRPVYRQLLPIRKRYADAVCIALTATAAPRVRSDIRQILSIPEKGVLVSGFDRPNLFLSAQRRTDGGAQLVEFLRAHEGQPGIIYCPTQALTETLAADLNALGISARPYHAGLDTDTRTRHQREFNRDEIQVIVATVAFGMGINKPNIRFVAHHSLPESLEGYYQEIGRAGRDGLRADCLLLFGQGDARLIGRFIESGAEAEKAGRQARLNAMMRYAASTRCRRASILPYFGDEETPANCGMCDNCTRPAGEVVDITPAAQVLLQCVLQTRERFGISHVLDILRGSRSAKVLDRRHDRLPVYNTGAQFSREQWRAWVDVFLDCGLIEQDLEYGALRVLSAGHEVLRGERAVSVPVESAAATRPGAADVEYDRGLFERLRTLRKEIADGQGVPPFVIFSDRTLVDMARFFPQSEAALLTMHGVGSRKLAAYGEPFLNLLREYCSERGLQEQQGTAPPPKPKSTLGKRAREVGRLFQEGASVADLEQRFGIRRGTVVQYLAEFVQGGGTLDPDRVLAAVQATEEMRERIRVAFAKHGIQRLRPVFEELEERVPYEELHLFRLYLQCASGDPEQPGQPV